MKVMTTFDLYNDDFYIINKKQQNAAFDRSMTLTGLPL